MELNKVREITLLFDGDCEFCNFWIQFIKKRKSNFQFKFFPLSSKEGKSLIQLYKINTDSVVVIKNNKAFIKSNAGFQIIKSLGKGWNLLLIFWIIPRPIRDLGYDYIAKNRYRLIKKNNCKIH